MGLFLGLSEQLDQKHPLYKLANVIDWKVFDNAFKQYYSEKMGAPSKPIRLMVSLMILKYLRNLSDESLVEQWSENCYYQYFSGEQYFRPEIPCVPTELVAFRYRVGETGIELILKESIRVNQPPHDDDDVGNVVSIDTTVQEKNITYPTDDKLAKKIIKKCWIIADREGVDLRQSYVRVVKKLSHQQRFKGRVNGSKIAKKASKKIQTIAGRLVRDISRKLPLERLGKHLSALKLYQRVLSQERNDKDKIYSLHEPNVKCYSKGKEHKKFEYGSKVSILVCQKSGIIMGAMNFTKTIHDSKTLPDVLEQFKRINGKEPQQAFVDRGYRGISQYGNTAIQLPKPDKNLSKQQRKKHSKRAAIEPIIGHLKQHYRLCRNYLKGIFGDTINVLLAAAAMNFKRVMNLWLTEENLRWLLIYKYIIRIYCNFIAPKQKNRLFEG